MLLSRRAGGWFGVTLVLITLPSLTDFRGLKAAARTAICSEDRSVQVRGGIEVVELRGLDDRVEGGGDFRAAS